MIDLNAAIAAARAQADTAVREDDGMATKLRVREALAARGAHRKRRFVIIGAIVGSMFGASAFAYQRGWISTPFGGGAPVVDRDSAALVAPPSKPDRASHGASASDSASDADSAVAVAAVAGSDQGSRSRSDSDSDSGSDSGSASGSASGSGSASASGSGSASASGSASGSASASASASAPRTVARPAGPSTPSTTGGATTTAPSTGGAPTIASARPTGDARPAVEPTTTGPTTGPSSPTTRSAELAAYRAAHELHFRGTDAAKALAAWDAYLAAYPSGTFAVDARFSRAAALVKLERYAEARTALAPFASAPTGSYRQAEAAKLLAALPIPAR